MNFNQFAKIIEDLRATNEVVQACDKYIKACVFAKHNILIADLLESMYQADAISYILYEWLLGNREPLRQTLPDGTEVIHELKTVHDLWKVMEMYPASDVEENFVDSVDKKN